MSTELFDAPGDPEAARGAVICLGCGAAFADLGELHQTHRHDADCERPGEVFR